jgi:hypothetical protein
LVKKSARGLGALQDADAYEYGFVCAERLGVRRPSAAFVRAQAFVIRLRSVRTKAPSPLRFAGAVQDAVAREFASMFAERLGLRAALLRFVLDAEPIRPNLIGDSLRMEHPRPGFEPASVRFEFTRMSLVSAQVPR